MSQFNAPPPPPGQMPPNYGQPPGGPVGYGQMPPPQRTSVAAIISLISGILGCFVITGIIAIISGIIGLSATSNPNVKGRGLAITGIILGLLFSLIGGGIGYGMYWGMGKIKEMAMEQTKPFVNAIVDGDIEKASQYTTIPRAELEKLSADMSGWGQMTTVSLSGFDAKKNNGRDTLTINGNATFEKAGQKQISVLLDDGGAGTLKIVGIEFK